MPHQYPSQPAEGVRASRAQGEISALQSQRDALVREHISSTGTTTSPSKRDGTAEQHGASGEHIPTEAQTAAAVAAAQATVSRHIKLLNDYNAIRDIGRELMAVVAEQRGVRLVDVMNEFGIEDGD